MVLAACAAAGPNSAADPAGLQTLASARGLRWGSAISSQGLDDPALTALLLRNVGSLTPENALKWGATEPAPGQFELDALDHLIAFSERHQLELRGHTLVWHQQLPGWLGALPPDELRNALERHVRTLVSHGRGHLQSWDVINEPIDPQGHGLRRSLWWERLGADYIADALRWARQADPSARLLINDYGLEGDDPQTARKRIALLQLIDDLQRRGVPLDGIGLQAHLLAPADGTAQFQSLPAFLAELRRRGLQLEITELDVSDRLLPADPSTRDKAVAATYDAFLGAVLPEPSLRRITSWGLSDQGSWLNTAFPRADGRPQRPLPYDAALQPKLARSTIAARLQSPARSR